eukprot:scaffold79907_cov34-Tisochrysis_lutea.AAC.3
MSWPAWALGRQHCPGRMAALAKAAASEWGPHAWYVALIPHATRQGGRVLGGQTVAFQLLIRVGPHSTFLTVAPTREAFIWSHSSCPYQTWVNVGRVTGDCGTIPEGGRGYTREGTRTRGTPDDCIP